MLNDKSSTRAATIMASADYLIRTEIHAPAAARPEPTNPTSLMKTRIREYEVLAHRQQLMHNNSSKANQFQFAFTLIS
jgi:hypothetical protein